FARFFLHLVDAVEEFSQQFWVAGAQEDQVLVLLGLAAGAGPVRQDHGVAEDVVAQAGHIDTQRLLQEFLGCFQLLYFLRTLQRQGQRRAAEVLHKGRGLQGVGVAAEVLHHQAKTDVVRNEAQQLLARGRRGGGKGEKQKASKAVGVR